MSFVDEGKVGTLIVKDMSRPGRDYLKVGYYTEVVLPGADVRFIAINNGVDSANQQDSDFTPFLNIIRILARKFALYSSQKANLGNHCVQIRHTAI